MSDCHVEPLAKSPTPAELAQVQSILLAVQGLGCRNCAMRVRNSLVSVVGVVEAHVMHDMGLAEVRFNPDLTDVPALVAAVAQAGDGGRHAYQARPLPGPAAAL